MFTKSTPIVFAANGVMSGTQFQPLDRLVLSVSQGQLYVWFARSRTIQVFQPV